MMKTYMYTVYKDAVTPSNEEKLSKIFNRNNKVKDFLNQNGIHFPINSTYFENNINRLLPILNKIDNLVLVLIFKEDETEVKVNCIGKKVNKMFKNMSEAYNWFMKEYEDIDTNDNINRILTYKIV